jgi:hypothetical protein
MESLTGRDDAFSMQRARDRGAARDENTSVEQTRFWMLEIHT